MSEKAKLKKGKNQIELKELWEPIMNISDPENDATVN